MTSAPKEILEIMLKNLDFDATVEAHPMEEGILLDVATEDSGRLIGRKGAALSALQYITNRILFNQSQDSPKVMIDIEGYRSKTRDALIQKAKDAAEKVSRWGDIVELEPMSAFDRRIIHNALKDNKTIETKSVEVEASDLKAILLKPVH